MKGLSTEVGIRSLVGKEDGVTFVTGQCIPRKLVGFSRLANQKGQKLKKYPEECMHYQKLKLVLTHHRLAKSNLNTCSSTFMS